MPQPDGGALSLPLGGGVYPEMDGSGVGDEKIPVTTTKLNDSMSSLLMGRLHTKSGQMRSWPELSKSMKQSLLEKRPLVTDSGDRFQLQRCLDTIQKQIEVCSVQSMVERLETICRQLKLKFICPKNYECFIHSEMYYVEIKLDMDTGRVLDCKVAHQTHEAQVRYQHGFPQSRHYHF